MESALSAERAVRKVFQILVISDQEEPISTGGEALSGTTVIRIVRPADALRALHHEVSDGIVVDMEPSHLGEYHFLYHIQAEYSRIPIVVVSRRDLIVRQYLQLTGIDVVAVLPRSPEPWRRRRKDLEWAVEWLVTAPGGRIVGTPEWARPAGQEGGDWSLVGRVFA